MPDDPNPSPAPIIPAKPFSAEPVAGDKTAPLHPRDNIETAGKKMRKHDAPEWPVAENSKLVGRVEAKNPDWEAAGHGHDPKTCQVSEIMKRDLVFCYVDETCANALKLMDDRGLHYLPVVDRQMRIVGIFSREEIQDISATPDVTKPIATQL